MPGLVPDNDLPSGLVPDSDLPETTRKTPRQMKETLPPLVSGRLGIHGPREGRVEDPGSMLRGISEFPYEAGGGVTDIGAKLGLPPQVSAGAGYLTNVGLNVLPSLLVPESKAATTIPLKDIEKMGTLKAAQQIGLDVPPSMKGAGPVEKGIESLGGKADIAREMSTKNREAIQIAARKEAGIPADQPINESTLEAARNRLAEPYRQISSLSPKASKALSDLKEARRQSKIYWNHYNRSADPESLKMAQKLESKAEKLEGTISKIAGDLAPDLLPALKEARVAIAKNYDIEKSFIPGTGEIDARALGRTLKKRGESGMSGDLQTIGKFAQAFPDFVQPKAAATDVSALRPYASLLGLSLGAGAGGEYLGHRFAGTNYGYVMAALPFLSPAARGVALSRLMQEGLLAPGASASRIGAASVLPLSSLSSQ